MAVATKTDLLKKQILTLLEEAFEKVHGIYLDGGTSLLETLATVSAEEASKPAVVGGTTIAGHAAHIKFYLNVTADYVDGKELGKLDWKQSWLVSSVTSAEWDTLRKELKKIYAALLTRFKGFRNWNDEKRLGGAMGIIAHTAFHIGAIRQIMRAVKK